MGFSLLSPEHSHHCLGPPEKVGHTLPECGYESVWDGLNIGCKVGARRWLLTFRHDWVDARCGLEASESASRKDRDAVTDLNLKQ
jgi:hypothetical protein